MSSSAELVKRLQSSSSSSKQLQAAATALLALPMTPQTWITAVGAIPALVELLAHPDAAVQLLAVQLLQRISNHPHDDESTVRTAPDGVVATLVTVMRQGREDVCEMATKALSSLSFNSDNRRQIQEAGAIAPLVHLLRSSSLVMHTCVVDWRTFQ